MASAASDRGRPPGRTALAGKAPRTTDAPDGARPGLVISELAHLGKLNLRGGDGIVPAVRKHTGCDRLPENNRTVTVGDRTLVSLTTAMIAGRRWMDPKTRLNSCLNEFNLRQPTHLRLQRTFKVIEEWGPSHEKMFVVGCYLNGQLVASAAAG